MKSKPDICFIINDKKYEMDEINIRALSAALQRKAEEEINETPEGLRSGLETLRKWINDSPNLGSFELRKLILNILI